MNGQHYTLVAKINKPGWGIVQRSSDGKITITRLSRFHQLGDGLLAPKNQTKMHRIDNSEWQEPGEFLAVIEKGEVAR